MRIPQRLPTAVLVVAPDGRVTSADRRCREILGRSPEAVVGRTLGELFGAAITPDELRDGGERTLLDPSGTLRTLAFDASPLTHVDTTGHTILVLQDISRIAQLQEERDNLMSIAAISESLPSLLHELKNPLAAVTAAVELLVEEVDERATGDQLYAVLSELRRMALGFEGIGAVHRPLRASRHAAIDYACREASRVLAGRARNAGIELRAAVEDMPLLPLDPAVVRALIFNFVINSIHACERGQAVRMSASYDRRRDRFTMSVVDTGAGMTPEVLAQATRLFFTTKPSGSGIGLALCKQAVEAAGGTLEITSVPGFGTRVHVSLPVSNQAPSSSKPGREAS